jgi:hypothetical protein
MPDLQVYVPTEVLELQSKTFQESLKELESTCVRLNSLNGQGDGIRLRLKNKLKKFIEGKNGTPSW